MPYKTFIKSFFDFRFEDVTDFKFLPLIYYGLVLIGLQ